MAFFHKNLTQEKWNSLPIEKQILNIAAEMNRAKNWQQKKDRNYMLKSMDRVLELMDLCSDDKKWQGGRLKELLRLRETCGRLYTDERQEISVEGLLKILLTFNKQSAKVVL